MALPLAENVFSILKNKYYQPQVVVADFFNAASALLGASTLAQYEGQSTHAVRKFSHSPASSFIAAIGSLICF